MDKTTITSKFAKPGSYYAWVGVFIIVLLVIMGIFYYATQKVQYIWRWNRLPIYFLYQDQIEVISDIDGDIEDIKKNGDKAIVTVKGLAVPEAKPYAVIPAKGTPMKFTRSLPANAIARAKVPVSTIGLSTLILVKSVKS